MSSTYRTFFGALLAPLLFVASLLAAQPASAYEQEHLSALLLVMTEDAQCNPTTGALEIPVAVDGGNSVDPYITVIGQNLPTVNSMIGRESHVDPAWDVLPLMGAGTFVFSVTVKWSDDGTEQTLSKTIVTDGSCSITPPVDEVEVLNTGASDTRGWVRFSSPCDGAVTKRVVEKTRDDGTVVAVNSKWRTTRFGPQTKAGIHRVSTRLGRHLADKTIQVGVRCDDSPRVVSEPVTLTRESSVS